MCDMSVNNTPQTTTDKTMSISKFIMMLLTVPVAINCNVQYRFHEDSEARNTFPIPPSDLGNGTVRTDVEYDIVSLENYIRNYRHGPNNERYILFNHDLIAAYVGPSPRGHPRPLANDYDLAKGVIRVWAMFDSRTRRYCDLNAVYDWGQLALFSCPHEGLYRAYAIETNTDNGILPPKLSLIKTSGKHVLAWSTRSQREIFDLINGQDYRNEIFNIPQSRDKVADPEDRVYAMSLWALGQSFTYTSVFNPTATALQPVPMVVSDPIRVKESYYCYYWMYNLREVARVGYFGTEIIHSIGDSGSRKPWHAYILLDLSIWIAEPSAVGPKETLETSREIEVSEYSKVITKRFSKAGLFPCLKKAHSSIEIVKEITYISEVDPSSYMYETPHWRATIKIHTDRLISTLSDIEFTIASRQNTASFHCFVGDTRVFYRLREFEFVPQRKLQPEHINVDVSNVYVDTVRDFNFAELNVYGHGVHLIGNKGSKKYQPASNRTDMVIITNPCIAQEFALAVGGSFYVAEGLLNKGTEQAKKVTIPYFTLKDNQGNKLASKDEPAPEEFLRIFDVAFTPTHVAFLMSEGYLVLHPSSARKKGVAEISGTMKYRLDSFVKRRWCSRTVSHKLSSLILPIFGETGTIVILQIYPTEGNVPVWNRASSQSCLAEASGFVKKKHEQENLINETDIHYQAFSAVVRTNHKTGLVEPPVPSRPAPPPPPERNIYEETMFVRDSVGKFFVEGEDPHFPPELIDPASHVLERNIEHYNEANIYEVESPGGMDRILTHNGLTPQEVFIRSLEFTVAEKQYVFCLMFNKESTVQSMFANSGDGNFLAVVSTLTIDNYPYRVKIASDQAKSSGQNEKLNYVAPFPGGLLVRNKAFQVDQAKSRDHVENTEHASELQGLTQVKFVPEIYVLGTAIPSYVINLGNVLIFTSIENRYARPLHFYSWNVLDQKQRDVKNGTNLSPLVFTNDSSILLEIDGEPKLLYDVVVTEHGMISVLRRKENRHLVQDDDECIVTWDTEAQKVIMGSVLTLEALREVKPFFRNDNIFQRGTPDGEIIYGVYDVKPRSSFRNCPPGLRNETANDTEACVEQPTQTLSASGNVIPVCTKEFDSIDGPCRDPGYIKECTARAPMDPFKACLRTNKACDDKEKSGRETEEFRRPSTISLACDDEEPTVTKCMPRHAPREDIRTVHMLGTSYHSYLEGSLEDVKSFHPESLPWEDEARRQEPDICPFASFRVYHQQLDFAEVGYHTRITGEISYFGTGIPTEADLLVEFQRYMGIIVELSASIEEQRHLTTIRKTVDVNFKMTDYQLRKLLDFDPAEKHEIRQHKFDFEDVRAREPFSVFSITLRPTIVNTRCKNTDFFKTVQFNVGCNVFSKMRLLSEATPLKRINWTEVEDETGFKWVRDPVNWNLSVPREHIYYKQVRGGVFKCDQKNRLCVIPYYHLFRDEIYTISYRDPLVPQFEEFLTVSSRLVTGNVVLYDMLGSKEFNWTLNKLDAGCYNTAHFWYDKLLAGTKHIGKDTFEHENLYLYYKDCFSTDESQGDREQSQNLYVSPFFFFNRTNKNTIKFLRKRNQLFIFRAAVLNTYYNRFTYCKHMDTYFMVRVTGIPIPRQGLDIWLYAAILLFVIIGLIISYVFFSKFYSGISTSI